MSSGLAFPVKPSCMFISLHLFTHTFPSLLFLEVGGVGLLGIEARSLCMLGKYSTTGLWLHPHPLYFWDAQPEGEGRLTKAAVVQPTAVTLCRSGVDGAPCRTSNDGHDCTLWKLRARSRHPWCRSGGSTGRSLCCECGGRKNSCTSQLVKLVFWAQLMLHFVEL